jgi:hypothetical protein
MQRELAGRDRKSTHSIDPAKSCGRDEVFRDELIDARCHAQVIAVRVRDRRRSQCAAAFKQCLLEGVCADAET